MPKKQQPNYIYKDNPRCLTCARYRPAKYYFTAHGHEVNICNELGKQYIKK